MQKINIIEPHRCKQCHNIVSMYHKLEREYNDICTTEVRKLKIKKQMKDIEELLQLLQKTI